MLNIARNQRNIIFTSIFVVSLRDTEVIKRTAR